MTPALIRRPLLRYGLTRTQARLVAADYTMGAHMTDLQTALTLFDQRPNSIFWPARDLLKGTQRQACGIIGELHIQ